MGKKVPKFLVDSTQAPQEKKQEAAEAENGENGLNNKGVKKRN